MLITRYRVFSVVWWLMMLLYASASGGSLLGALSSHGGFSASYYPPGVQENIEQGWPAPVIEMGFSHVITHEGLDKISLTLNSDILWSKIDDDPVSWQHFGVQGGLYFGVLSTVELGVVVKYLRDNPSQYDLAEDIAKNVVKGVSVKWDW
jgi:hypothetical protein